MAVRPGIAHPDRTALGQPDPAGALDLQEEQLDRVVDPGDLEPAFGQQPFLDDLAAGSGTGPPPPPRAWRRTREAVHVVGGE
jgi:hypothetical protein